MGSPYVTFPGTSGRYAARADTGVADPIRITGDIDLRCKASVLNADIANGATLIGRYTSVTPNRAYRMFITTTTFGFWGSSNGSSGNLLQTKAHGLTEAELAAANEWRITRDASTGTVEYFLNGVSLGTGSTTAVDLFAADEDLYIGAHQSGQSGLLEGNVYWAEVLDGIDGTVVARFDAADVLAAVA